MRKKLKKDDFVKVIAPDTEKIENEKETKITWDDVFKEFRTTKNLGDFEISYNDWLKENYVVPKKIK